MVHLTVLVVHVDSDLVSKIFSFNIMADACTGDFGEQNVELVRAVSELPLSKAVILGNHDAWLPFGPKKE